MNILEQLVDNIPEGDYTAKMKAVLRLPAVNFISGLKQPGENLEFIL